MRRRLAPAAVLGLLIPLVGCAGDGGSGADDGSGDGSGGGGRQIRELRVGVVPLVDVAPLYLGVEQGFFDERGLDVEFVPGPAGAAAVPGLVSGDYDFAFVNVTSVLLAVADGVPLRIVANGVATTGDPESDYSGVVVPGGSPIRAPADLVGTRVAVNDLQNIGEVTIRKAVQDAGGDPAGVAFVELHFPQMPAAVTAGEVDAAWVVEPFLTVSESQGNRSILAPFAEPIEDLTVACYVTTEQMLQEEPDLVDEFQAAMQESLTYADENPDEVRRIILTYTQVPPEAAEAMALPSFPAQPDWDSVRTVAELMQEFGITGEQVDVDALRATD